MITIALTHPNSTQFHNFRENSPQDLRIALLLWALNKPIYHWIGLRENLNRKPWFLPSNIGLKPVNFPIIQFYEFIDLITHELGIPRDLQPLRFLGSSYQNGQTSWVTMKIWGFIKPSPFKINISTTGQSPYWLESLFLFPQICFFSPMFYHKPTDFC